MYVQYKADMSDRHFDESRYRLKAQYANRKRTVSALIATSGLLAVIGMVALSGPVQAKKPTETPAPTVTSVPTLSPSPEPTKTYPSEWPEPQPSIDPQN